MWTHGESLDKLTRAAELSAGKVWPASPALLRLLPRQYHDALADRCIIANYRPHKGMTLVRHYGGVISTCTNSLTCIWF